MTARAVDTLLGCADCSMPYSDPGWCDAVIPNETWERIAPIAQGGIVLCFECLARRLVRAGLRNVPLKITSGPFDVTAAPTGKRLPAACIMACRDLIHAVDTMHIAPTRKNWIRLRAAANIVRRMVCDTRPLPSRPA